MIERIITSPNRIYYELDSFSMTRTFELEQCFCSCWPKCDPRCGNYGKEELEHPDPEITIIATCGSKRVQLTAKVKELKWEELKDIEDKPE